MGLPIPRKDFTDEDRGRFIERLRRDLLALEELLQRPGFGEGEATLGAEMELALVGADSRALHMNREVLGRSLDDGLQLELNRFNLEYNLTPQPVKGKPFRRIEAEMGIALVGVGEAAARHGGRVVPIGILPTLTEADLQSSSLTDLPRYHALSASLRAARQGPFEISIKGDEEVKLTCDDCTLEGANTSLQIHWRVPPKQFASAFNAAQLAAGITLAIGANSPTFLGRRLWDETRVALFKQSVDDRSLNYSEWKRLARVPFGHGWVREGVLELFQSAVALFPPLMPVTGDDDPLEVLRSGGVPALHELRLHQSTVWQWNRAVYDPGGGGHVRIEMRALPAGPTPRDMMASAAFMLGLAEGLRRQMDWIIPSFPFWYAQYNFYRAAKLGLDADLLWPSTVPPSPRERGARDLIHELLPTAERGLASLGVEEEEIDRVLDVIRGRLESKTTGARWQRRVLDRFERVSRHDKALARLVEAYVKEARTGKPVHEWGDAA